MGRKIKQSIKSSIMDFDTIYWCQSKKKLIEKPKELQRAVIYCRVSEMKQVKEWFGLEGQERVCKERCNNQSIPIEVDRVFVEEGISWSTMSRKEFDACIAYLDEQNKKYTKITHFVVSEASRISRPDDIVEAFTMEASIKATWVKIITLDMPWIDESTDEWHLFKTIQYAIAGYERKKIKKRASNGRINRLKNGYRAFPFPPVWYKREKYWTKNYEDIIDDTKWPILKEALELFANDIILSQADLRRFLNGKGFRTNAKNCTKLHKTFPEKLLQLHRLFYYAGHIYYPERWITEPIIAKHIGLIDLETAYKIIDKLKIIHGRHKRVKMCTHKMTDENPLRWAIICPNCNRRFTSWTTNKYKMKDGVKIKKEYPYYGCNNSSCDQKVNVGKAKLEEQFASLLSWIKLPNEISTLIKEIFTQERSNAVKRKKNLGEDKKQSLLRLHTRQRKLEETMLRTSHTKLYEKLEKEWSEIESEKDRITKLLVVQKDYDKTKKELLDQTQLLFKNPLALRKKWSSTIRWLLIKVRFWDKLTYTKVDGLQTKSTWVLTNLSGQINLLSSFFRQKGKKHKTIDPCLVQQLEQALIANTEYITAISNHIEYHGIKIDEEWQSAEKSLEPP